ncbi:Hypothetical protein F387_00999 [Wohlfahrtiimonas chitiniclastica SH04]|uniref:Uncharacterized protein n=1 Tax=Wohlfahrtiimonas chitiniclastica SH04 TaxID=1261130 RepID=L8XYW7_9GAMM|nr:Hypothetical protein F387_00999 [Wohlfahrtiimonas chitiniclastica SH04]
MKRLSHHKGKVTEDEWHKLRT